MSGGKTPYLTSDEFKRILIDDPLDSVVDNYVLGTGTPPYVFRKEPETMDLLHAHLCEDKLLALSENSIRVVGSGKLGFSLSPDNFPRSFSNASDIDVLVVDEVLFDKVWRAVLNWHYPRRGVHLGGADGDWARARRKELYWGWFTPDKITFKGLSFPSVLAPLRDISTAWFNVFQSLSLYPEFASRTVTGRLYRTWEHARLYQEYGLRQIRNTLVAGE